jgi:predicted nucleic acid-binding protein
MPVLTVHWVDDDLYRRGVERLWREDRRRVSLVDCVGFELMKTKGITTAFAVDPHFKQAGFVLTPGRLDDNG